MMKKLHFAVLSSILISSALSASAIEVQTGYDYWELDPTRIATTIGEGTKTCHVVTTWNDKAGIDNLAVSVKFSDEETLSPEDVMEKIFSSDSDWRFYKTEDGDYCFDLNGDKVRSGEAVQYDHSQKDGGEENHEWVITAPHEEVWDGDVLWIEFRNPVDVPRLEPGETGPEPFYLPAADTAGVWFLPDQSFALADATYQLPLYINLCGGSYSSLSLTYYKEDNTTRLTTVCTVAMTAALGKAGATTATLTTKGEGLVHVAMRLSYIPEGETKSQYTEYSYTPLTVTPAKKALESLSFKTQDTPFQLSHSYDLSEYIEMVPADATYTGGLTFKYVSPTPAIAGVSGTKLNTRTTPGTCVVSVTSKANSSITAQGEFEIALVNPVTNLEFVNIDPSEVFEMEFDPYKMEYNAKCALIKVTPEDADISKLNLKILESNIDTEDGKVEFEFGSGKLQFQKNKYDLISTYQQNDGAYDLYVWGYGEATIVFEATDGTEVQTPPLTIKAVPRHSDITDDFQDGTFWLNEDWFGHTNSSMNYIDADGEIHYRIYNFANFNEETPRENATFGCTAQYGMIFGDRLYVMSKQNDDGGDRYQQGGGRLVIADAKTLKRLHSFDVIGADEQRGGDGRACVGVSSDKVYIGHHAGIRVLNIDNSAETPEEMFQLGKELTFSDSTGDLTPGNPQGALYSNQIGDMVCAGGHVFAVMQDKGLLVIDTETDTHKTTLGDGYVQAVTQSADGNVWYARNNTETGVVSLHCVEPETLEELGVYDLPEGAGTINTGWGAWRSANFFASREKNVLFWANVGSGYQDDILGKGTGEIFRWEIGEPLPTAPFFELGEVPGKDAETLQSPYATMRYDDRYDRILMATTHGASYNYRYNWIYFINGTTGEIERVQEMDRYFWFPAIPIFPDKENVDIALDEITITELGKEVEIDLSEYLSDADNIDRNIKVAVLENSLQMLADLEDETAEPIEVTEEEPREEPTEGTEEEPTEEPEEEPEETVADMEYKLEGKRLKVKLNNDVEKTLTLRAESNGKVVTKEIPVKYDVETGIESLNHCDAKVALRSGELYMEGLADCTVSLYSLDGCLIWHGDIKTDIHRQSLPIERGIYVVKSSNGFTQKLINR